MFWWVKVKSFFFIFLFVVTNIFFFNLVVRNIESKKSSMLGSIYFKLHLVVKIVKNKLFVIAQRLYPLHFYRYLSMSRTYTSMLGSINSIVGIRERSSVVCLFSNYILAVFRRVILIYSQYILQWQKYAILMLKINFKCLLNFPNRKQHFQELRQCFTFQMRY